MLSVPSTRYARCGGVSLAYQDFGQGRVTLVAVPPLAKNIEIAWECAQYRHYFERLASFSRYVHFDKRGTGASDQTVPVPSLDTRVDDLRAVMDAAGVDRAFLWGASDGGPTAMLFAVTYPDRVEGLILDGTAASLVPPSGSPAVEKRRLAREAWLDRWGTDETLTLAFMAPSVVSDPWYRAWQPRYERQSASPAALRDLVCMVDELDVTAVLSAINVPTLARHRVDDAVVPIRRARETVAAIPGARLVEFPGADHFVHTGSDVARGLTSSRSSLPALAPAAAGISSGIDPVETARSRSSGPSVGSRSSSATRRFRCRCGDPDGPASCVRDWQQPVASPFPGNSSLTSSGPKTSESNGSALACRSSFRPSDGSWAAAWLPIATRCDSI